MVYDITLVCQQTRVWISFEAEVSFNDGVW
jgi:hypothetical protein